MRVPTYQRQTATTAKTGAINFSVRANPGALAAGQRAVGDLFASVENAALSWYEQEQKLKRQEKLSQKEIELDNALETLKNEQKNRDPMMVLDGDPGNNELSFSELAMNKLDELALGIDDKGSAARSYQQPGRLLTAHRSRSIRMRETGLSISEPLHHCKQLRS